MRTWPLAALAALCVLFAFVTRLGFLSRPFESDSGLYILLGKLICSGGRLYIDVYETKPPGVALVGALFWRIFGEWWPGYVLAQLGLTMLAAWGMGRCVGQVAGDAARMPTTLYVLVYLNFGPMAYRGFQLETLQATLAIGAAVCCCRIFCCSRICRVGVPAHRSGAVGEYAHPTGRAIYAGLFAGCAAMIKPTGAAVLGALAVALFVGRKRFSTRVLVKLAFAALAGFMLPILAVAAWVVHAGLLAQMPELWRQIRLYGAQTPLVPADAVMLPAIALLFGFPTLVRGWIFRRERTGQAADNSTQPRDSLRIFALAWLVLEVAGVFLQKRLYGYHMLVIGPPAAILFGMLPRRTSAASMALALLPVVGFSLVWSAGDFRRLMETGWRKSPVAKYLIAHTTADDAIFADPMERLLMETGRRPGARYATLFYFVNYDTAPIEYGQTLLADLEDRRPKYVVLKSYLDQTLTRQAEQLPLLATRPARRQNFLAAWENLKQYVSAHYTAETEVDKQTIWRRRD